MKRHHAAIVAGEYAEWAEDEGPSRATGHACGHAGGKRRAGPRTIHGTTDLVQRGPQATQTSRPCFHCGRPTLAAYCLQCEAELFGRVLLQAPGRRA